MEQQNKSQKNVGIIISIVVLVAVTAVTAFSENKSSAVQSSNQTSSQTVSTAQTSGKNTSVTVSASRSDDDNSQSDDDDIANKSTVQTSSTPTPVPVVTQTPPVDTTKKSVYKNGTYSATGSYNSPGGYDQLGVIVTLSNDIITNVSVTSGAGDRTSQRYQNMFISGYKTYVVGQNIASVNLGKISGSSLTPIGFNDALSQIKSQAKA